MCLFIRILQKCALVHSAKVTERDSRYQEKVKVKVEQDDVRYELILGRETIEKLTRLIKSTEKNLHKVCMHVTFHPCTYDEILWGAIL